MVQTNRTERKTEIMKINAKVDQPTYIDNTQDQEVDNLLNHGSKVYAAGTSEQER